MADENPNDPGPFVVLDCALVVLATGLNAIDLRELRDRLSHVEAASIDHHFWGRLLQPQFDEPEYNNDFASWAFHSLHDSVLAERLSAVDPSDFASLEDLRSDLIDLVEARLDEADRAGWRQADDPFYFTKSQVIIFDAHLSAASPEELGRLLPTLSPGSIYFHFIEARRREPVKIDDFSAWTARFGEAYAPLVAELRALDPYFSSLRRIQDNLSDIFSRQLEGVADGPA